jgi:hypothetical protein
MAGFPTVKHFDKAIPTIFILYSVRTVYNFHRVCRSFLSQEKGEVLWTISLPFRCITKLSIEYCCNQSIPYK